jgi:hypothetical protein
MNKKERESELMNEWEFELSKLGTPKFKFPLKVIEPDLEKINLDFPDPSIKEPRKRKDNNPQEIKIIELGRKKNSNKKDKKKLF